MNVVNNFRNIRFGVSLSIEINYSANEEKIKFTKYEIINLKKI